MINRQIYQARRNDVSHQLDLARTEHPRESIDTCQKDQHKLFNIVHGLLVTKSGSGTLPTHDNKQELASTFSKFFAEKMLLINDRLKSSIDFFSLDPFKDLCPFGKLIEFRPASEEEIIKLVCESSSATCGLDALPSKLPISSILHSNPV